MMKWMQVSRISSLSARVVRINQGMISPVMSTRSRDEEGTCVIRVTQSFIQKLCPVDRTMCVNCCAVLAG